MPDGYPAERLAELTATSVARLASLEEFGLLHRLDDGTYAADSVERVTLVRHAEARGITDDHIERFCRGRGDILESLLAGRRIDAPALTVEELLARLPSDIDDDFVTRLLNLLGLAPGEPLTEDDAGALQMAIAALDLGFPADALLQLIRVMTEAVQRVAEAENRVFHDYVHERNRAKGLSGRELMDATDALSQPMLAMAEPALIYLHQRAFAREMRDDFVRHLTEDARPPSDRPGEAVATIVFIDLAGFTPMTLTMGDTVAADVLSRFATLVRTAVSRWHGRIIKQIGDAFMLVFELPTNAVRFGVDVCAAVAGESRFPAVHLGAHHGPA
ncbi:MAG TPA: adenylate/guanylate cyclase domain-containing protein, partial [Mycobacteriales bacterium]|nr:adenylate/guanylate cyclase domain-containing protein [Mycobacteriales bacterium]